MLCLSIELVEWKFQFRQSGFKWRPALDDLSSSKLPIEYLISETVYQCDMYRAEKMTKEI